MNEQPRVPEPVVKRHHILELDGLRGIAILLVITTHYFNGRVVPNAGLVMRGAALLAGLGWSGVDLFFVLSGFLITGILVDSKGSDGYFTTFYLRRTLRIFPLYYVFLILMLWVLPSVFPADFPRVTHSSWMYWVYLSNYRSGSRELLVSWSLAIEEQFYLVWPAVVYLVSAKKLPWICASFIVLALVYRIIVALVASDSNATFFHTLSRLDGLSIGAFIAIAFRNGDVFAKLARFAAIALWPSFSLFAVVVICAQLHHLDVQSYVPGKLLGSGCTAVFFGAVLVLTLVNRPKVLRFLLLRFFGKYSYSLYLFHLSVLTIIDNHVKGLRDLVKMRPLIVGSVLHVCVCLIATVLVSLFSWNVLEQPILRLKRYFPERQASNLV